MKAYLKELQSKLLGSVTDNPDVLEHFSTDGSIFQAAPAGVVYPANTADVRKTVQFVAERTAAGKDLSLVPRGKGSGRAGGAIGEGMQLVFPTHMNKLLRLERNSVTVQPGISYRTLQQTLHTHGHYLPPYPASLDYATVGGAVADDAAGVKSYKYGSTRAFVTGLKVVLADGSLVQTRRISSRELNRKKGLSSLEGEIYRKLDGLLLDHAALIAEHQPKTTRNTAGYALSSVRGAGGSFDLTQIFLGSQGTLGAITEVTLRTLPYNPRSSLVVGYFNSIDSAAIAVQKLRALGPSAVEMVNYHVLHYLRQHQPADVEGLVPSELPKIMLFVEFDNYSQFTQKLKSGRAARIMARYKAKTRTASDPIEQVALWKILHDASTANWLTPGSKSALPFIDDAIVPADKVPQFLDKIYKLMAKYDLDASVWGHVGDGNLSLEPALDLSKRRDADKLFHLTSEFCDTVIALGGTTSGGQGDGLLRSLYLHQLYGDNMMELFDEVKQVFDPHGIFNPHHITGVTESYVRDHLRDNYRLGHLYEFANVN